MYKLELENKFDPHGNHIQEPGIWAEKIDTLPVLQ